MMRAILGILVGYGVWVGCSLLWSWIAGTEPTGAIPNEVLAAFALAGAVSSLAAGYVAAAAGGRRLIGIGVALIILGFSIWRLVEAYRLQGGGGSTAITWISVLLMAPCAICGGLLWHHHAKR